MKLFKKALLATAVFGAMGAQAATISSTAFELSKEGVAFGVAPTVKTVTFDVVVDKEHPSSSTITLNFDENVDLNDLVGGEVTQSVGGGTAFAGDVAFNYGTGSFTFDNVVVEDNDNSKGETDSITFQVNLGNPLTANSAFRVTLGAHNVSDGEEIDDGAGSTVVVDCVAGTPAGACGVDKVLIAGESDLDYISHTAADVVIETGTGKLAEEVSQYGLSITEKLDGVINRLDGTAFIYTGSASLAIEELGYTVTNDETLGLALQNSDLRVVLDGSFDELNLFNDIALDSTGATSPEVEGAINLTDPEDGIYVRYIDTTNTDEEFETEEVITFTPGGAEIPVTGNVVASLLVMDATNATEDFPLTGYVALNDLDAGKWEIDATIINVPYVPINAANTQTFIHFANETQDDVDVIVTAIDNNGVEYGPMDLGYDLPAHTVTKFSQTAMDTFFGLEGASTKLSITFNVDADKDEVTAYAVSQNDSGRTEVSTSQQRGN